ncbi:hypothetical protein QBC39DRAFT_327622 [Podospora conica]|nr:hypothetical protein QBC39DRAFT_327622 [Schizothecium conicum]
MPHHVTISDNSSVVFDAPGRLQLSSCKIATAAIIQYLDAHVPLQPPSGIKGAPNFATHSTWASLNDTKKASRYYGYYIRLRRYFPYRRYRSEGVTIANRRDLIRLTYRLITETRIRSIVLLRRRRNTPTPPPPPTSQLVVSKDSDLDSDSIKTTEIGYLARRILYTSILYFYSGVDTRATTGATAGTTAGVIAGLYRGRPSLTLNYEADTVIVPVALLVFG